MMHPIPTNIHIAAGAIALLAGYIALFSRKGQYIHRRAGSVFFWSMLIMASLGAYGAALKWELISVLNGLLTCYLVTTAWFTVKRKVGETRRLDYVLFFAVLTIGLAHIGLGTKAMVSASGEFQGFLPVAYFIFGSVALIAAFMDMLMFRNGGVFGHHRIVRHLWRMCFAFFIATAALFGGQPQVFPEAIQGTFWLAVPILVIILTTLYYLIRVLFTKLYKRT